MHIRGKKSPPPLLSINTKHYNVMQLEITILVNCQGSASVWHQEIISNIKPNQEKIDKIKKPKL